MRGMSKYLAKGVLDRWNGSIKEVGRAGGGAVVVVKLCSDNGGGAADRDGKAKEVNCSTVRRQQLRALARPPFAYRTLAAAIHRLYAGLRKAGR